MGSKNGLSANLTPFPSYTEVKNKQVGSYNEGSSEGEKGRAGDQGGVRGRATEKGQRRKLSHEFMNIDKNQFADLECGTDTCTNTWLSQSPRSENTRNENPCYLEWRQGRN